METTETIPEEDHAWVARPLKKPEKTRWKMYFNRLANYATSRNWTVKLDAKEDACCPDEKKIWIKKGKRLPETKVYILMHELGHMLLFSRYGDYLDRAAEHKISKRSYAYVVYEIEEEIDAWRCGLDIGESMRVPINSRHYEMVKARYLSTYLRFLLDRRLKSNPSRVITKKQNKVLPLLVKPIKLVRKKK